MKFLRYSSTLATSFPGSAWECIFVWIMISLFVSGCSIYSASPVREERITVHRDPVKPYTNILESSYAVGDILAQSMRDRKVSFNMPVLAASFVNIDNLNESCTLGRVVSEQIASRLAQHGFKIIEIKLRRESVFVKKGEGEFLLSRELRDITAANDVHAVLVGTYALSDHSVFVSARIVLTEDSAVVTGQDYELSLDFTTRSLVE